MHVAPALVLLAQALSAGAAGRPLECAALDAGGVGNVWERAKAPETRRYCDLLASGAAKLAGGAGGAREALAIADEAEHVAPGHAAPSVLRGRALSRLGLWADALAALERARDRDPRALDDPPALLAWARVLARA